MITVPGRKGLLLADGRFQIRHCNHTGQYHCRVSFDLSREGTLLIECLDPMPLDHNVHESFFLEIPHATDSVECIPAQTQVRMSGNQFGLYPSLIPRFSNVTIDRGRPLVRVNAGIANLAQYLIASPATTDFCLEADGWRFDFTLVDDRRVRYSPEFQDATYFFTHHLVFEKADHTQFSGSEADEQLERLSLFFTFCHEHWVSPALVYGVDDSGVVSFEQWGTRMLSKWHTGQNWMDPHHGEIMAEVFPAFVRCFKRPQWKEPVKKLLYWYVRADTGYVGPDGAVILLQAALELLCWHILVRDTSALSEAGFSRLTAADHIRLLLKIASIPREMPPGLARLQAAARQCGWTDGPEAFVGVRNHLVHPPRKTRVRIGHPYYDAYLLGKWYLELVLLHEFGYSGKYSNRTNPARWIGQVEPVPWAK